MMTSEFPNSCFIFDEIHAYDSTITGLTVATAKYLTENNASCLFLSATMPAFLRRILEDEIPSITFLEPSFDDQSDRRILEKKRHSLSIAEGNILTNLDAIMQTIKKTDSTLIVCNHVPSAQMVYDELRNKVEGPIALLHSRFCRRDRDCIESSLQSKLPKVLVATQVVEVSLDIDFDRAFSDPAPIDALVQRLGRVNRRGEKPLADVTIFREQINNFAIYNKDTVKKSISELESLPNPLGEQDLIEATNRVYEKGYDAEDWNSYNSALNHPLIKNYKKNLLAGVHNDWTEQIIEKADGTVELLPESLVKEYEDYEAQGLWIEANRLLVPVRTLSLTYLFQYLDKKNDPWIIKRPYSKSSGLILKVEDELD
jgi:CRISPR-associated endonuclease/helicase Cas3